MDFKISIIFIIEFFYLFNTLSYNNIFFTNIMLELYNKLKTFNLKDALDFESDDRQFIALKNLEKKISDKELYLALIIANSIICYQLSWKGEDYWEEFSEYFSKNKIEYENIITEISKFIVNSKNNKRFVDTKQKRLEKIRSFIENDFNYKSAYFYENMTELRNILAKIMKQKIDAKTIVFAVKMFWYWARNIYDLKEYPSEISIPIDSRLTYLFEKYKWEYTDINNFYSDLSKKIKISPLHLDWIVWNLYDELIK